MNFNKIKKAQVQALTLEQLHGTFELNGLTIRNRFSNQGFYFDIYLENDKKKRLACYCATSDKALNQVKNGLFKTLNILNVLLNDMDCLISDETSDFVALGYVNKSTLKLTDDGSFYEEIGDKEHTIINHRHIMAYYYNSKAYQATLSMF